MIYIIRWIIGLEDPFSFLFPKNHVKFFRAQCIFTNHWIKRIFPGSERFSPRLIGENRGRFRTRFYVIERKFNLLVLSGSTTGQHVLQYRLLVFRADESRDGEDCVTFRSRGEVVNTVRRRKIEWKFSSKEIDTRFSILYEMYKIFDLIFETRPIVCIYIYIDQFRYNTFINRDRIFHKSESTKDILSAM